MSTGSYDAGERAKEMLELLIVATVLGVIGLAAMLVLFSLILLPFKLVFGILKCGLWLLIGIPLVLAGLVLGITMLPLLLVVFPVLFVLALPFLLLYALL